MTPRFSRRLTLALGLVALLWLPSGTRAQDAGKAKKDPALEDLLKEIEGTAPKPKATSPDEAGKAKGEKADAARPADPRTGPEAKPGPESSKPSATGADRPAKPAPDAKKAAPVAPADKELDSLLEKLGETPDRPTPDDRRGGGMPPPDQEEKPKPPESGTGGKKPTDETRGPDQGGLSGEAKDLDEHLEELTGVRRKKKDDGGEGGEQGPLSDVIKQMRDVEKRLGETDTGEETRKKQQQIVQRLETLIEQMRSASAQSQGKQRRQLAVKPGQQPGQDQQGENPGTMSGGAPNTRPAKPTNKRVLAGGKDEWGHLPPELRQEMENVFREEFLPSREELIRRYYDSMARKAVKR